MSKKPSLKYTIRLMFTGLALGAFACTEASEKKNDEQCAQNFQAKLFQHFREKDPERCEQYRIGNNPELYKQYLQQWHADSNDAEWKRRVMVYVKSGGKLHEEYGINTNPDYTDEGQKRQVAAKYWATFKDVKPDNSGYEYWNDKSHIENYWNSILNTLGNNTTDSWKTILYKSYPYWDNLKAQELLRKQIQQNRFREQLKF